MDGVAQELAVIGAVKFSGVLVDALARLENIITGLPSESAGIRLQAIEPLRKMLVADGRIGSIPAQFLGAGAKPVRVVLFNKTAETNWSLAWHQDRTICVKAKREVEGFGPWTVKQGFVHVAPPADLLAKMITIRVHLDAVPATNAPLLIAPGSHREGMVPVGKIERTVARLGTSICLADAGDVWVYSTLILHASAASQQAKARRVLQVDYAAFDLPGGLEWQGI